MDPPRACADGFLLTSGASGGVGVKKMGCPAYRKSDRETLGSLASNFGVLILRQRQLRLLRHVMHVCQLADAS